MPCLLILTPPRGVYLILADAVLNISGYGMLIQTLDKPLDKTINKKPLTIDELRLKRILYYSR